MNSEIKFIAKILLKSSYRRMIFFNQMHSGIHFLGGDKTHPKVLIIKRKNINVGTFSDYIMFLGGVEIALRYGYIPVIDRKTIKNSFLPASESVNTWELFFEQPMGVVIDEVDYKHYQVYELYVDNYLPVQITFCNSKLISSFWRELANKYMRLKQDYISEFEMTKNNLFNNNRVLGVAIREGYNKLEELKSKLNFNHPRQLDVESMIDYVCEYLEKWNCDKVFFTCQTIETVEAFNRRFGERAICTKRNRPCYADLSEGDNFKPKEYNDAFFNEKSYIEEMYLLSKCNCLLCNQNSGIDAAIIMSSGYDEMLCIDNGLYT